MKPFNLVSLSPLWLPDGSAPELIPAAAVRADGLGLLDAEFCPEEGVPAATATLGRLLAALPAADAGEPVAGLRLDWAQRHTHAPLLAALADRSHHLVLCGWDARTVAADLAALAAPARHIWREVGAVADTTRLDITALSAAGAAARKLLSSSPSI
jgi:hypothetical protein